MPFLPALVEHLLLRGGPPRVVEYDDAVFHRYDRHRSALVRRLLGAKIDRLMAGAAVVVAGNAYLAARARAAGARDVAIIPSVVDLDRYPVAPPPAGGPPVIGWIGSPSTAAALDAIAPALARVCAGGRARVVLVGVTPGRRAVAVPVRGAAVDRRARGGGDRRLRHRHHAARRRAVVARQVRLQAGAVPRVRASGGRLAGRRQPGHRDRRRDRPARLDARTSGWPRSIA